MTLIEVYVRERVRVSFGASVLWDILESRFAGRATSVPYPPEIVINFYELRQRQFFVESPFSNVNYGYILLRLNLVHFLYFLFILFKKRRSRLSCVLFSCIVH